MMSLFAQVKLSNVANIISGYAFKSEDLTSNKAGVPVLKIANVTSPVATLVFEDHFPREKISDRIAKYLILDRDVLVAMTGMGSVGRVGVVRGICESVLLNQRVGVVRGKRSVYDQQFLGCVLTAKHYEKTLYDLGVGAGQPNVSPKDIANLLVPLPTLSVQKRVAAILIAYDELIENNRRRISLLEKMAEEIYREWFVRLRFPSHEKAKKVKGIPEGWRIDRVDSIGKVVTGKTPSTSNSRYFGGPYLFIKTPDMHGNIFVFETEETLSQDGLDSQPSQTIPEGSICVSCIGTGGIVSIATSQCQTNQQINSVVLRDQSDLEWAFFTLRNLRETIQIFGSTGTTMTNLSKGKFSSLKIIRPDRNIVLDYHALVNPMFDQMKSILQQTRVLIRSRDALLPRLISGKLSVENLDIQFPPSMEESAHA